MLVENYNYLFMDDVQRVLELVRSATSGSRSTSTSRWVSG